MLNAVFYLEKILRQEVQVYREIHDIEESKKNAIIAKNGNEIELLSIRQEELIERIVLLDKEREFYIDEYRKANHFDDWERPVRLDEMLALMDEDSSLHLQSLGHELRELLYSIKDLQDMNQQLLGDNLQFYNLLLTGMKNKASMPAGYSDRGMERPVYTRPVLFNQTV